MPYLTTPRTVMYYERFPAEFTAEDRHPQNVLLIHGMAGTPESDFKGQIPRLRERYHVLAPHLHGYGRSTHRERYEVTFYRDDAADLAALLDTLQLEQALVLGFSDGGIVGLLLAALYPERVRALAVMGAQHRITAENLVGIRHWLLERPLDEEWQQELAQLHGEPYWRDLPRMYVEGQQALVAAGGVLITGEELANIRCPALIMHGKRDRVVPADYALAIAQHLPHAEVLLFDAGHAAHLKCEQEYTTAVLDFFEMYG
jgi:pimeloyl-ACP methyl ester carboxylesterase